MDRQVITTSEIEALIKKIEAKSADQLAYLASANEIFYYILDCKRVIEGQAAIIKHLEAQHGKDANA